MSDNKNNERVSELDDNEVIIKHINGHIMAECHSNDDILNDFINITRKALSRKYRMDPKCDDMNIMISQLIISRLELGRTRYGHGIRISDDTRQYGTEDNDWKLMALEEMLDGLIYTTADYFREQGNQY